MADPGAVFDQIDADGSGGIGVEELHKALTGGGQYAFDLAVTRRLLNMYDADRGGTLGRDEFVKLFQTLDAWGGAFRQADSDGSREVDVNELARLLAGCGFRISMQTVSTMFRAYDKDGTGSLGFDEFVAILAELRILTGFFAPRDTLRNGNATMSYEEFLLGAFLIK